MGALTCALHGCVTSIEFDPTGTDVSLDGSWQFAALGEAARPSDAAVCARTAIAEVRLLIHDFATNDVYFDSRLQFPCSQGVFDTRPAAILERGNFQAQWSGVGAGGVARQTLPITEILARDASHVTVSPGLFELFDPSGADVTLAGSWQLPNEDGDLVPAVANVCALWGVDLVRVVVYPADDEDPAFVSDALTFPCAAGAFDTRPTPVLRAGEYRMRWEALTASGVPRVRGHLFDVEAALPAHVDVPVGDLEPRDTDARVVVDTGWERDGDFRSCGKAGVTSIDYRLVDAAGRVHADSGAGDCKDELRFRKVPFEVYTLELTGTGAEQAWTGSCTVRVGSPSTQRVRCLSFFQ